MTQPGWTSQPVRLRYREGDGPPIETALRPAEALRLQELAAGKIVLEVGAAFGYSTITMAVVAGQVVAVDNFQDIPGSRDEYFRNLDAYGIAYRVVTMVGHTRVVLPKLRFDTFDLMFIDGDHHREGVEFDALMGKWLVRPGGVIAFHDYGMVDRCEEVKPTVDRLFRVDRVTETLAEVVVTL